MSTDTKPLDTGKLWKKYLPIIQMKARIIAKGSGRNWEDLASVGTTIFVKACATWDPEGGSTLESWIHTRLRGMYNELRKLDIPRESDTPLAYDPRQKEERVAAFKEKMEAVSEDTRHIIFVLLHKSAEVLGIPILDEGNPPGHKLKGALRQYCVDKGWGRRRWDRIRNEIVDIIK